MARPGVCRELFSQALLETHSDLNSCFWGQGFLRNTAAPCLAKYVGGLLRRPNTTGCPVQDEEEMSSTRVSEERVYSLTQTLVLLFPLHGIRNLVGHPGQLCCRVLQASYGLLGGLAWKCEARQLCVTLHAFIHRIYLFVLFIFLFLLFFFLLLFILFLFLGL